MISGKRTFGRLIGATTAVMFAGLPAWILFTTRHTVTAYTVDERVAQTRALFTNSIGAGVTASEAVQHLGRLCLWAVAAVLWMMLVVVPLAQAARHLRKTGKGETPQSANDRTGRWQLKAATWVLSLTLFGVAGQGSAQEPRVDPIVLSDTDFKQGEDPHVVMIRKGQSLRGVLHQWLAVNHPQVAETLSERDINEWTRTVLAQNPSDNWTKDSYLENVSAMMVQVAALPSPATVTVAPGGGVDVTAVIGELLPEDVDWGDSSEFETSDGLHNPGEAGLEASKENVLIAAEAAETRYDLAPAGAPTVDTWTENSSAETRPGNVLVKAAAVGAGAAAAVAAGRLLRSLRIWREAADGQDVTIGEDETAAVATLATLASKDPTELRSVAARTVAASADQKGVPSMSALMINCDTGDMLALLLRGDKSQPRPGTPWTRPTDHFLWSSSIDIHRQHPRMLTGLESQLDPYPCLVCLGDLPGQSGSLWIDLEVFNNVRIGIRKTSGVDPEEAARLGLSTMWAWALELLTGPTGACEVIVCGFGEDLRMMGARHYPSLNQDALEYVSRRVKELNDNTLDGLLEGRPASQLRMITGSTASLSPLVVFVPFPPTEKDMDHADTLWEMANFFDRRAVTCVFGFRPPASTADPSVHFPLVTIEPDPNGPAGAHKASMDNPPLPNLYRRTIDPETQKQIRRVLKRHYKTITDPKKPVKRRDHLANVTVPAQKVVPTASAGTEPEHFHLRLFGEPKLSRGNTPMRLLPGDIEMVSFLAAAGRAVTLEELGWVAGHNPSFAERRYVQTRNRLGHDPDGKLFLAPRTYEIQTGHFSCDLHQFENIHNLLVREQAIDDPQKRAEAAKSALGLVTGRPFGPAASRWPWTEGFPNAAWNVVIKIDQLVHSYARAAKSAGNWHEVLWATSRRILVHPSPCVTCYEHAAEAAEHSGQPDAAQNIRQQLHHKKTSQDFYLPHAAAGE